MVDSGQVSHSKPRPCKTGQYSEMLSISNKIMWIALFDECAATAVRLRGRLSDPELSQLAADLTQVDESIKI